MCVLPKHPHHLPEIEEIEFAGPRLLLLGLDRMRAGELWRERYGPEGVCLCVRADAVAPGD